ncbi:hypothetical protein PUATCC27989T_00793 [Phytobacter ursingii]|nr:hypothetical protein PUATCC27989T_00793 [Phytobacter ursingii]
MSAYSACRTSILFESTHVAYSRQPHPDDLLRHTHDIVTILALDRVSACIITNHNQRTTERGGIDTLNIVALMSRLANQPLAFHLQLR